MRFPSTRVRITQYNFDNADRLPQLLSLLYPISFRLQQGRTQYFRNEMKKIVKTQKKKPKKKDKTKKNKKKSRVFMIII